MIWGGGTVKPSTLDEVKRHGTILLGFNEPDLKDQANMSVEQALDLWPQLQATRHAVGEPGARVRCRYPGQLVRPVHGRCGRSVGYRVDFIALHWYGSDFSAAATGHLRAYLQAVYDRYHKPIWLTEYALINFARIAEVPDRPAAVRLRDVVGRDAGVSLLCGAIRMVCVAGHRRHGHGPLRGRRQPDRRGRRLSLGRLATPRPARLPR